MGLRLGQANAKKIPAEMPGLARILQLYLTVTNIFFSFLKVLWHLPAEQAARGTDSPAGLFLYTREILCRAVKWGLLCIGTSFRFYRIAVEPLAK